MCYLHVLQSQFVNFFLLKDHVSRSSTLFSGHTHTLTSLSGGAEKLRTAEKLAKSKKLRLWKDYSGNVGDANNVDRATYTGKVRRALSVYFLFSLSAWPWFFLFIVVVTSDYRSFKKSYHECAIVPIIPLNRWSKSVTVTTWAWNAKMALCASSSWPAFARLGPARPLPPSPALRLRIRRRDRGLCTTFPTCLRHASSCERNWWARRSVPFFILSASLFLNLTLIGGHLWAPPPIVYVKSSPLLVNENYRL